MLYKQFIMKNTARVLLTVLSFELLFPLAANALTTGPSQPEVQSFEPVGTTDMVDLFSGDFVYNIPLLDVEGYPVNISYHSGADMEQEASWVGLGWNINVGAINRTVRGMPDDFNGEVIQKELNIKPETNVRVGLGGGLELAGSGTPLIGVSANMGLSLNVSNYKGVSTDFTIGAGVNVIGMVSAGFDLGVSSQNGADVDYNAGLSFSSSMIVKSDISVGVGVQMNHGYNSRSGLKDRQFGGSIGVTYKGSGGGIRTSASVPIGTRNVIPVVTNVSNLSVLRGQIKLGAELFSVYPYATVNGMVSKLTYEPDGSMKGFGYLYAQNADDASIMDFTRDRDGIYNETMHFLPPGNMTYDIYSVSGQGTGGSFRPYRNDFGSVYDPLISSGGDDVSVNLEVGLGNLFELGTDVSVSRTDIVSGPWDAYKRPFTQRNSGSIYENVYFKQAGEASEVNAGIFNAIQGLSPLDGTATSSLPLTKPGSDTRRDPRGNLIYYFTADEASRYGVASSQKIHNYTSTNGFASGANTSKTEIDRVSGSRKGHHISEVVQVQTDGRRYIYGIPAMNNSQEEYTFAVPPSGTNNGIVSFNSGDASSGNGNGRDHFYTKTATPAYAHSYLLTSVLSTDYVDITGDGVTDDDFGSFTKFNYSRKHANYKWKVPYGKDLAQYNPGFKSDTEDDKASFIKGDREQWLLHSIESKNFVAEFYTSLRADARGVDTGADFSYKLDSIRLFNKHDRFANTTSAVPVKTVIFNYDYSLCKGVANNANYLKYNVVDANSGKLTLLRIMVRYGNSDKSMISPYQFAYKNNRNYSIATKDRWGTYKPNTGAMNNTDFPFIDQNDSELNDHMAAWALGEIALPSGGKIEVDYEADDYAYVQDKVAMEMFLLQGLGSSPNFSSGAHLYLDKDNPNTYLYFTRRISSEIPDLNFQDNYLKGHSILYYNFNTQLVGSNYEPIKGYAEVEEVGACSDGVHGYVKLKPVSITGGGASLNHPSYTALNFARYYLPHIIFPGADPSQGSIANILAGMQYAFSELVSITKNPVKRMTQEGKARQVQLSHSYIRLNSPGLKKKGGGCRVKELRFKDNWSKLAGGNSQDAQYGKRYNYTTTDAGSYGAISSGVASYEPAIGGDENPFREPVNYEAQSGGKFPPHDPVGIYQELPVGESLYPGAMVGYSRVTVSSIHQSEGRSSQGMDIHEFYTSKDFPVRAEATTKNPLGTDSKYSFREQRRISEGSQGYTLIFNDMHGKPRRTEHRIFKPSSATSELVSYKQYTYNTEQGKLSSTVPVMEYDPVASMMRKVNKTVGLEADITIDTREKKEETRSHTLYGSLNVFLIGVFPVPVGLIYGFDFNFKNEFRSVVATKVVQQYGLLKEVQSMQEGAITTVRNEAFDALTGQALITSVNNEFNDKEYSVDYPAYWGYKSMGPSFLNTGFEQQFDSVAVINSQAILPGITAGHFKVGDEVFMTYTEGGVPKQNNAWVNSIYLPGTTSSPDLWKCYDCELGTVIDTVTMSVDNSEVYKSCGSTIHHVTLYNSCGKLALALTPRYKASWTANGTLRKVKVKIVRSGAKNQLNESIQEYTTMSQPYDGNGFLKDTPNDLISVSARTYSDTMTAILPRFDASLNPNGWDSLNIFLNGTKQVKRISKEYVYLKNRNYGVNDSRRGGLFTAASLWRSGGNPDICEPYEIYCKNPSGPDGNYPTSMVRFLSYISLGYVNDYNYFTPDTSFDNNWVVARSVTKWSPWGHELENKDAIGNFTAAQYGYNQQLPVAVAQNARQHQMFAESFEDFRVLEIASSLARLSYSPFAGFFSLAQLSGTNYAQYSLSGGSVTLSTSAAHSGSYSLSTASSATLQFPMAANPVGNGQPQYKNFTMEHNQRYLLSYWFRPHSISSLVHAYSAPLGQLRSNIIDGWQQADMIITAPSSGSTYSLTFPSGLYIDDIRMLPLNANMKAFVYHPINQRLIATLDENNFASFYEYDQEGNLIRTKKETEKGIITVMESRSANAKGVIN